MQTKRVLVQAGYTSALACGCLVQAVPVAAQSQQPMNVVLIYIDDLNVTPQALTPNIDALAAQGTYFNRAYAPVAVCGASRSAIMSGVLPVKGEDSSALGAPPNVQTLPDTFRDAGYMTASYGKVYHSTSHDADAWTEGTWRVVSQWQNKNPVDPVSGYGPAYEIAVGPTNLIYGDERTADQVVQDMSVFTDSGTPFFMGVGFERPHLAFTAPQQYWDLYDPNQIVLPTDRSPPVNSISFLRGSGEIMSYAGIPDLTGLYRLDDTFSDELRRNLIHGYMAAISYADAQVGKVLEALDDPNGDGNTSDSVRDNTIIALTSDHGFLLGDHGMWGKHNVFDKSLRVPMVIVDPRRDAGNESDALVSAMDLYPTLATLAGLDTPAHVEGNDLTPLLTDPNRPWADYVYGHYNASDSIRTDRYRYILIGSQEAVFDMQLDPSESINIAPTMDPVILNQLRAMMQAHFANGFAAVTQQAGDLDGDGSIDQQDLNLLIAHFGQQVAPYSLIDGDINGDGQVGIRDLDTLLANWTGPGAPSTVPEPTSLLALGAGALMLTRRRRTR